MLDIFLEKFFTNESIFLFAEKSLKIVIKFLLSI
jgi:hypothetical protein